MSQTISSLEPAVPAPRPVPPTIAQAPSSSVTHDTESLSSRASLRALTLLPATALLADALVLLLACGVALVLRQLGLLATPASIDAQDAAVVALPVILVGWLLAIGLIGGYSRRIFGAGADEYRRVAQASLLAAGLIGTLCYLTRYPLSRGFFLTAVLVGVPLLLLGRFTLRAALHTARQRGSVGLKAVIVGSPSHVDELAAVLGRERWMGYRVVGTLTPGGGPESTFAGWPVLGDPLDVAAVTAEHDADVVFITAGAYASAEATRQVVWDLEPHGVQVVVAPGVTDIAAGRITVRPMAGLPLMHLEAPRWRAATRGAKRLFDIVGSLALLTAFSPLLLLIALRIKAHDGGPIFFRQTRIGKDEEAFPCLKFRTMVPDAELRLSELKVDGHVGLFKLKEDPRITVPGRWLRRYSFDELPQLFNVLRGEMSLVGPRPPLPTEVAQYPPQMRHRLRVRPGMTGLWQVSGRSDLTFDESVRLDLYYVDNWSMLQDLSILFRTLRAVLSARGAY
ncbi:sugar transferase [Nocardioides limicola]|uniref:sugar transferase n=1 Tax=Nocardioides limicola TaxID=2803368 RepID=UPI00193BD1DD|nr:sugar transferase [Nocardioides sp. DJM-14]